MRTTRFLAQLFALGGMLLLQVTVLREVVLFEGQWLAAYCFCYVGFLFFISESMPRSLLMLLALGAGLVVDTFYNSLGVHGAAMVFTAFVIRAWVSRNQPEMASTGVFRPYLPHVSLLWFARVALPLFFIHHLLVFTIQAASWDLMFRALALAFFSSLYSFLVYSLVLYLFIRKRD